MIAAIGAMRVNTVLLVRISQYLHIFNRYDISDFYVKLAIFDVSENLMSNCPPSHFRCVNKRCIRSTMMCNGEDDCGDNTDETLGCNGRMIYDTIF